MAQSRKRSGHHPHQKSSAVHARQRTNGRIVWALLFGVFGLLMAFFASDGYYVYLVIGAVLGCLLGYYIGRRMEEDVAHK